MATAIPPPERQEAVRVRSWIIYSFWFVILFLGLPTWWQTTSIPRAALPLDDMLTWSQTPETRPLYVVPVHVAIPDIPCETALKVVTETQQLLNEKASGWGFEISINLSRFEIAGTKRAGAGAVGCSAYVQDVVPEFQTATLDIELKPGSEFSLNTSSGSVPVIATYSPANLDTLASELAKALHEITYEEKIAVANQYYGLGRSEPDLLDFLNNVPWDLTKTIQDDTTRAFKASPAYHLTFSLFTPGGFPSRWDIDAMLDQHIHPLVHGLSSSTNFSIATQVQLYSAFSPSIQPYQEDGVGGWLLRRTDLTAFVNTAEWPLSPSVGSGPTINFVLYVPSKNQMPLHVEGNENAAVLGGSWIVPQWGGIAILNAPVVRNDPESTRENIVAHLTGDHLSPIFDIFRSQLISLLGVPASSSTSLPLRLKTFQRLSAFSLYMRTVSTLGSLARLAQHLNSIPIPRHVSELVALAMDSLRVYKSAWEADRRSSAASEGYKASEKAFFDKSMVGQVYFPDEHKVAVYLPLLGPIGVPLVVSLIREIKALKARLKR